MSLALPSNPLARGPSTTTGSPYHCSWLPQNGPTILSFNHQKSGDDDGKKDGFEVYADSIRLAEEKLSHAGVVVDDVGKVGRLGVVVVWNLIDQSL